jgi:hypothetical protein
MNTHPIRVRSMALCLLTLGACDPTSASPASAAPAMTALDAASTSAEPEESSMWMSVGERHFAITLVDNAVSRAFRALLPLTLDMSDLNANEKHTTLPRALPANESRPGTIHNGDIMLYGTDTLVVFYRTFASSYSYTRIGRVNDAAELPQALGQRSVQVVFTEDQPAN